MNTKGNPSFGTEHVGKKPTRKPLRVQDLQLNLSPEDTLDPAKVAKAFIMPRLQEYLVVMHNKAVFDADKDCAKYLADRVLGPLKDGLDKSDSLVEHLSVLVRVAQTGPGEGPELESPEDDFPDSGIHPQP